MQKGDPHLTQAFYFYVSILRHKKVLDIWHLGFGSVPVSTCALHQGANSNRPPKVVPAVNRYLWGWFVACKFGK